MILFENFKSFLSLVVSNAQTVSQNSVLSDSSYAQAIQDHISALTSDQNIRLDSSKVAATNGSSGLMVNDQLNREIRFEWKGAERLQGWVRPLFHGGGNVSSGFKKIWVRRDDSLGTATTVPYGTLSDGRRYYVTDEDHGVLYLNEHGQPLGAVPGFLASGTPVLPQYGQPSSAITFEVDGVEYLAVSNQVDHIINIYSTSNFTLIQSLGTPGTSGLPTTGDLSGPVDLAFDPDTSTLYVACTEGTPPSSTGPGYIASFNASDLPLSAPVFIDYVAINSGDGTLPQGQVTIPVSLHFDASLQSLWVLNDLTTNTNNPFQTGYPYMEAGALSVTTGVSNNFLTAHIDGRSSEYWLRLQDTKLHLDEERRKLYVGNEGSVEVFDLTTLRHQMTFGYYSNDSKLIGGNPLTPQVPHMSSSSVAQSSSVASDILSVDGSVRNLVLFTDLTNNRFVRYPEDAYLGDNIVTFEALSYSVPVSLHGYLVKGTIPSSKVCIEFRTSATGTWQRLAQTDSVPASDFFQFRIRVTPDLVDIIDEKSIKEVVIVGEQE